MKCMLQFAMWKFRSCVAGSMHLAKTIRARVGAHDTLRRGTSLTRWCAMRAVSCSPQQRHCARLRLLCQNVHVHLPETEQRLCVARQKFRAHHSTEKQTANFTGVCKKLKRSILAWMFNTRPRITDHAVAVEDTKILDINQSALRLRLQWSKRKCSSMKCRIRTFSAEPSPFPRLNLTVLMMCMPGTD
eukprot:SAG31_NODE_5116_length_2731_cov_1.876900_4_plen_188_part_00